MKKLAALFISIITVCLFAWQASAAETKAELYSIYQSGMVFKQNSVSSIAGKASQGSRIEVEITDEEGRSSSFSSTASADNTFAVDFAAPQGSYKSYKITVKQNGEAFAVLNDVLFGELWIASGQSNMQYALAETIDKAQGNAKSSEWLRMLYVQPVSFYDGKTDYAVKDPQPDSIGCSWVKGNTEDARACSAVGYFFGIKLQNKLDMPVGVISCSLGGSAISTWISREKIDSNQFVRDSLIASGEYYDYDSWNPEERSQFYDLSVNYNMKLYPLRHLSVSGMIWYQGETDVILGHSPALYAEMINLLQDTYTENFRCEKDIPLIFTQLASFYYNDKTDLFLEMNNSFAAIQQKKPESRSLVTIYDIPLDYFEAAGSIHPGYKKDIGERMALNAMGLVYDKTDAYTAATVESHEISDGVIYVSYKNIGDGLMCDGEKLKGFSVCGENGVYVPAEAEIVSKYTVAVWNDEINSPVSASYAYVLDNYDCNLYSSRDGEKYLPAASFITDKKYCNNLYDGMFFTEHKSDTVWHSSGSNCGYASSWKTENCNAAYNGEALSIKATPTALKRKFYVSPSMYEKSGILKEYYDDVNRDYSDYSAIAFTIKNTGKSDVKLSELKFYVNDAFYYSSICDINIPADGKEHFVSLNLNELKALGIKTSVTRSNSVLTDVSDIRFVFESKVNKEACIEIDNFKISADAEKNLSPEKPKFNGSIKDYIEAIVNYLFYLFSRLLSGNC